MDVFEGADRGWEISQTRALVGYIYLSGGWAISLKMSRNFWVATLRR